MKKSSSKRKHAAIRTRVSGHLMKIMKANKWSYRTMGLACEMDYKEIYKYCKGTKGIRLSTLEKIASMLCISLLDLLKPIE